MANLVKKKMKKVKKAKNKEEQATILGFDENGRPIKEKKPIKKGPIIAVASIAVILGFLYLPACVKEPTKSLSNSKVTTLNNEMIRTATTYFNTYPDEDFDGDGLSNSLEISYGTNPYSCDSDGDGLTDYTEIYNLNTSPMTWNRNLQNFVASIDESNEATTGTPYKIGNVILWADNLYSKSYGGVVKVIDGYQFSNFNGWAQFPDNGYAYQYVDGIHKKLEYRADSNAYRIDGTMRVVFFSEDMEKHYRFEAFGNVSYLDDDTFGEILDFILPDYGNKAFLKCYPVMDCDKVGVDRQDVVLEIKTPEYELTDDRFSKNDESFETLSKVFTYINAGKNVAASLYLDNHGETLIDIYGYTSDGDLLIADLETLTPCGVLSINEKCGRRMDANNVVSIQQWFTFNGIGYGTQNWSRLVFLFDESSDFDGTPFVPNMSNGNTDEQPTATTETPEVTTAATTATEVPPETTVSETEPVGAETTDDTTENIGDDTTTPVEEEDPDNSETNVTEDTTEPSETDVTESSEEPATTTAATSVSSNPVTTSATTSGTTTVATTASTTENTAFDFSTF